jgi:hypothetical protein
LLMDSVRKTCKLMVAAEKKNSLESKLKDLDNAVSTLKC